LDNIDNVLRAATAMGINDVDPSIAITLANSFTFDGNKICLNELARKLCFNLEADSTNTLWMIFASIRDFALQTMLKDALGKLSNGGSMSSLLENDWKLTDKRVNS